MQGQLVNFEPEEPLQHFRSQCEFMGLCQLEEEE